MISLLSNPCPIANSLRRRYLWALLAGLFVGVFIIIFQPFGIQSIRLPEKHLMLSGYGLITTVILIAANSWQYFYLQAKPAREQQWSVGRQILFILAEVLAIAIANFLYSAHLGFVAISAAGLLYFISFTFLVGFFPVVASTFYLYIRMLRKHVAIANSTNTQLAQASEIPLVGRPASGTKTLILRGENKDEVLEIDPAAIICLAAAGNYTEIFWLQDNTLHKHLLRSSLSGLEMQLELQHCVLRCHRSYMVNLKHIRKVSGNAQGYMLHLNPTDLQLPLSRSYAPEILQKIGQKL